MNITIHRGTHQIGGTCIEISSLQTRLIFDIGAELPDLDNPDKISILNVDDLFKTSKSTNKKIDGIFISHNHGDHIGLLKDVKDDIPVFMGKWAHEINNVIANFIPDGKITNYLNFFIPEKQIIINDITVTPFLIDHSAFDAYAFLIECDGKKVIYTGDFRRHGVKGSLTVHLSNHIKAHNPDALLIEGTNLYKDDFIAEKEDMLQQRAEKFMKDINGTVFILQSSANIDRITQIYKAAKHTNRTLLVDIFTAHILMKMPTTIPNPRTFKDVKIFYPYWLTKKMFDNKEDELMNMFSMYKLPKEELKNRSDLCILVRENMLFDITHRMNYTNSGLIYSKWEGYKKDPKTTKFLSFFENFNLPTTSIHTSGHADIPTIKAFVGGLKPKMIIPIHTTTPEKYKELFGDIVNLANDNTIINI